MECSFDVIQHTPLIHFQPGQKGATLRGTGLGSALDKFLKGRLDNRWFRDDGSLDYQIRISPDTGNAERIDQKDYPVYFGNIGDGPDKQFKHNHGIITIKFKSFNSEIIRAISDAFPAFLLNHNFGTRQGKGFGSFLIKNQSFDCSLIQNCVTDVYKFESNVDFVFKDIAFFGNMLRSGINRKDIPFYAKSLLFLYAKDNLTDMTWEKKKIKETFFSAKLREQQRNHPGSCVLYDIRSPYLLRDLLGLSSEQEWKKPYHAKITKSHATIKRASSPLFFKPIRRPTQNKNKNNNRNPDPVDVYFWGKQIDSDLFNQQFEIACNTTPAGAAPLILSTPHSYQFDLKAFLNYAVHVDLSNVIQSNGNSSLDRDVTRIFRSIKTFCASPRGGNNDAQ